MNFMKMNYPIVYAVMPIKHQTKCIVGSNDVTCYIVSKCHLIGKKTIYKADGKIKDEYEVVFPYQRNDNYWKYEEPSYNLMNGRCINSDSVDAVFDSYEKALEYRDRLNQELYEKTWSSLPISDNFKEVMDEKKKEFCNILNKYKSLKEQILKNTLELNDNNRKKLSFIIKSDGTLSSINLYQFIELFHDSKYLVYSITEEEYDFIANQSSETKPISKVPILLCDSVISRLINNAQKGCYYLDNGLLRYSEKISPVTKNEISNISEDTMVVYTTETMKDVMDSYRRYDKINLSELEEKEQTPIKKLKKI